MKISVVTVCFNAVDVIEETMLSVLNQTYPNVEYIVIDGGSTDGTVNIIKKYADRLAFWISEPDKGIFDAMNKGVLHATGEYINYMNAGDRFFDQNVISEIIEKLPTAILPDVIYGDWLAKYTDGYEKCHAKVENLNFKMALCHQAIFLKNSIMRERPFDLTFKFAADFNLFHKLFIENFSFHNIGKYIAIYDHSGLSSSRNSISPIYREYHRILELPFSYRKYIIFKISEQIKHLLYPFVPSKLMDYIRKRPANSKRHYQLDEINQIRLS